MGFRKPLDLSIVSSQIRKAGSELNSPYNDGFIQWQIKQDLYEIKWLVDDILKNSSTFSDEEEFLKEHEQTEMWQTLKK